MASLKFFAESCAGADVDAATLFSAAAASQIKGRKDQIPMMMATLAEPAVIGEIVEKLTSELLAQHGHPGA